MPSRLDDLTERARRTLERSAGAAPRPPASPITPPAFPRPVAPVAPVTSVAPVAVPPPGQSPDIQRPGDPAQVVLGIDPGTGTTGYGVITPLTGHAGEGGLIAFRALAYGVILTDRHEPMERRLLSLYRDLRALIQEHHPTHLAIEQLFFGRNVTTAVTVGQARGVILLAAAEAGISISEYKPAEIKYTVAGFGKADKAQMQRMVRLLLDLETIPRPDDAADALAIALCHLRHTQTRAVGLR